MFGIEYTVNNGIILASVLMSIYAWQRNEVLYGWMLNPPAIDRGQYYRFVTSGFIHADFMHLFFNMFTLYNFGGFIEGVMQEKFGLEIGRAAYLIFYIVAIIVSDVPSYFKHKGNSQYNSLGASGAVSAIVFGAILFVPLAKIGIFWDPEKTGFGIPAFIYAFLYLWYTYYEMKRGVGYINHSAHWWGAIFGIVIMAVLYPQMVPIFFEKIMSWRPF